MRSDLSRSSRTCACVTSVCALVLAAGPGSACADMIPFTSAFARVIVGAAGVLLTRVEYLKLDKAKRFAVVDASMSELIRPAL